MFINTLLSLLIVISGITFSTNHNLKEESVEIIDAKENKGKVIKTKLGTKWICDVENTTSDGEGNKQDENNYYQTNVMVNIKTNKKTLYIYNDSDYDIDIYSDSNYDEKVKVNNFQTNIKKKTYYIWNNVTKNITYNLWVHADSKDNELLKIKVYDYKIDK